MRKIYDRQYQRDRIVLAPGEYFVTDQKVVLYTVLGSCVAVCLKDIETGIAGMNHFMLPEPVLIDTFWTSDSTRFGKQAMEALLKNLLSQGASRKRLVAKVFGGAQVIKQQASGDRSIPTANINFAMTYLNLEGIKVVAQDTGGIRGRRIMFFTDSGVVYVQKLHAAQEIE